MEYEDGKTEEIPNVDVKEIIVQTDKGTLVYENIFYYESIKRKKIEKKPRFMKMLIKGAVTLYMDNRENVTHMTTV